MNTTITGDEKLDGFFKRHINRNLLKYEAGSAIFCPGCQAIMDCRRTVVTTIHRHLAGQDEECVAKYVLCAKCWAKQGPAARDVFSKTAKTHPELGAIMEIVTWSKTERLTE